MPKSAENRTFCTKFKVYKKCAKSVVLRTFRHFPALFLESAETPFFVQINVFAVWPLRLDRKYTKLCFYLGGWFLGVGLHFMNFFGTEQRLSSPKRKSKSPVPL